MKNALLTPLSVMYLPTAAGQSSFENETTKPFGTQSLPANCSGPASAPTAKTPASLKVFQTGIIVFDELKPVTKSTLASSISFDAPCTASAGLVLSSTTVYLTGRPPSLLPSSSRARSMPRLVSVPAGEIGPLSCVRLPSLTWSAACVPVQRASNVVEARAIRRIVVSSLWRSFDCNALPNLIIEQQASSNVVRDRRTGGWSHSRCRVRPSLRSSAPVRARARNGGRQVERGP